MILNRQGAGFDDGFEPLQRPQNSEAGKSRTGRILVALQMTLCLVLLVGAGLLIRSLRNLENTPLGFNVEGLAVFGVHPKIESLTQGRTFYEI